MLTWSYEDHKVSAFRYAVRGSSMRDANLLIIPCQQLKTRTKLELLLGVFRQPGGVSPCDVGEHRLRLGGIPHDC